MIPNAMQRRLEEQRHVRDAACQLVTEPKAPQVFCLDVLAVGFTPGRMGLDPQVELSVSPLP